MNVRLDLIVVEGDFDETTLSDDLLRRHRDMIHDGTSPPVLRRARFSGKYMMSAEEHDDPCSPTSPR